jgi:hypothetical protein
MFYPVHIFAAMMLFFLPHMAGAEAIAGRFTPGTPYYFDDFDPGKQSWEPGRFLNLEEVFKNYQYYEIVFDPDGKGITVNHYLRGSKESSEKYLLSPENSLRKKQAKSLL